jgi:DNA repair protein SbcC/Rad50
LSRAIINRLNLGKVLDELVIADEMVERAANSVAIAEADHGKARARQQELDHLWAHGQAAILASGLADGEACPVCGAVHHPSLATSLDQLPTQNDVEKQRSLVDRLGRQRDEALRLESTREQARAELLGEEKNLAEQLGDYIYVELEELEQRRAVAADWVSEASVAKQRLPVAETNVALMETKLTEARSKALALSEALVRTQLEWASAESALNHASKELPEAFRLPGALGIEIKLTHDSVARLTALVDAARRTLDEKQQALVGAQSSLEPTKRHAEGARAMADSVHDSFNERRALAGFVDNEEYQSAKREPDLVDEIDETIRAFDDALHLARNLAARASVEAEELEQPDLEVLETAVKTASAHLQDLIQENGELTESLRQIDQFIAHLAKVESQFQYARSRHEVTEYVSGVANGNAQYNHFRVPFNRFVLSAFLDEVLFVASERLQRMTKGRFDLQRAGGLSNRRRTGGLDLEVSDSYTGTERPVATLSGGEGFLAALALALGLSEVVQAHAGGIRLDTMFVDEGFGSLDSEALQEAVNTLMDLGSGRLVGIISHVSEMRESITARLEVVGGKSGSVATFHV